MKHLNRDHYSQAIINTDNVGYRAAKIRKQRLLSDRNRINKLERELAEIKEMLKQNDYRPTTN